MRDVAPRLSMLSLLATLLFAALTVIVVIGWTQGFDDTWNSAMSSAEISPFVTAAEVFHRLGSFEVALATAVAVGVILTLAKRWELFIAWVVMVGGAEILSVTTKALVGRERPLDGLVVETSAAYPSGHSMVAGAAMGVGLAMIASMIRPSNRLFYLSAAGVYAVLMALSRTYLRAHWLTDVVGGLLFGTAVVFGVMWLVVRRAEPELSASDP